MKYITRVQTVQERLRVKENNASFEIAALFHRLCGDGKSAVISKLALSLSTLRGRSSNDCTLNLTLDLGFRLTLDYKLVPQF